MLDYFRRLEAVIAVASIWLGGPLVLGLGDTPDSCWVITAIVGALTVLPGRATIQEERRSPGALRLAFLSLAVNP